MDYLPLFIDLKQRQVLVIGGGEVAARKVALLLRAGAKITVVALDLVQELAILYQQEQLKWQNKRFTVDDLEGVFLVITATNNPRFNQTVFQMAEQRHILVNTVDNKKYCSFIFPSIIDRNPILVAISSSGEAPVLVRLLREKLEALLPNSLGKMAQIAGSWRERVKQKLTKMSERRYFWESVFNSLFTVQVKKGDYQQAEETLASLLESPQSPIGEVILVGAGPGDPGLMTLKGLQALQEADVVLFDHLVSQEILELVRRDAQQLYVGKQAKKHCVAQNEINQKLISLAREGKRVVRLKGGDPFIFGRGGEELLQLARAGIPYQVIPGITAAAGATAYAGIPLTHRDYAQSVLFITGHCRTENDRLNWALLAQHHQTLAIYMGTVKAAEIQYKLIEHGREPTTPIAVISCGTRQQQQVLTGYLYQLEQLATSIPSPTLLVIGEVVALQQQLAWFKQEKVQTTIRKSIVNLF